MCTALVVDDDPNDQVWLTRILRRNGIEAESVSDGIEALETLKTRAFDLLIIDLKMPRGDGFTTITAVREQPEHSDVFAIMLSGRDESATRIEALELGFDDFIGKGWSEAEITARLKAARRLIERQRNLSLINRQLFGLAAEDELTGIFNRRYFFAEAEQVLKRQELFNVVLLDLDDFKQINDTYGHLTGDRILADVGAVIQRMTRVEDLPARYGGDEFILAVSGVTIDVAQKVADRLRDGIRQLRWTVGTETLSLGVTYGISCKQLLPEATLTELVGVADHDLYKSKYLKKNGKPLPPHLYEYRRGEPEAQIVPLPPAAEPSDEPKPRVLIVEDDAPLRSLIRKVLERQRLEVFSAHDGEAAIAALESLDFDVVLLDLMMPRVSGFEVIDYLRLRKPGILQLVLVMTAASDDFVSRLDSKAVHGILRKPFDIHELVNVVNTIATAAKVVLKHRHEHDRPASGGAASTRPAQERAK